MTQTPAGEAWKLMGYDAFSNEWYSLGTPLTPEGNSFDSLQPSYSSYDAALADARRRLEHLEKSQPSASSGGQASGGIQDRVFIVHPDGHRERVSG